MPDSPRRIRIAHRLQFWLERQFLRGASYQLLAVIAFIGLISLVGGLLVLPLQSGHLGEAVWWAFLRLSDPGYLGDDEGAWRRVVSTVLTVAGYVVFLGALVAIMTQSLNARMRRLESGLTPVATRDHLVILGWTGRTVPVVREILQSEGRVRRFLALRHVSRLRLVVLCDEVTPWHAQTLRDDPAIGRRGRHIVLRSGIPLVVDDLERVDCGNAAAVIIPGGAAGPSLSSDMATAKALLSLANLPRVRGGGLPYVVAEVHDPRNLTVLRRAYPGPLEVVPGNSLIGRLLAQNLRQPGLSRVYRELLSHGIGCGIFVREHGALAGARFGDVARRFRQAVVCGVVRPAGEGFLPHLNCPEDFSIEADDRLVFVAERYEDTALPAAPRAGAAGEPASAPGIPPATGGPAVPAPRRLLLLGWSSKVAGMLGELAGYQDEAFQVTVVSLVNAEARRRQLERVGAGPGSGASAGRIECRHVEADYTDEAELRGLAPEGFDSVLLASSERLVSGEEADTRTLIGKLLLEELFDHCATPPQVLLELQDPDNESLVGGRGVEVLVSPLILAHMVAQVALRRELRAVFDALFTAGGPELVLAPAAHYVGPGRYRFETLQAIARERGEILLGTSLDRGGRLLLIPGPDQEVAFAAGDELVLLTGGP